MCVCVCVGGGSPSLSIFIKGPISFCLLLDTKVEAEVDNASDTLPEY